MSVCPRLHRLGPTPSPHAGLSIVYVERAKTPLVDDHLYVTGSPNLRVTVVALFAVRVAVGIIGVVDIIYAKLATAENGALAVRHPIALIVLVEVIDIGVAYVVPVVHVGIVLSRVYLINGATDGADDGASDLPRDIERLTLCADVYVPGSGDACSVASALLTVTLIAVLVFLFPAASRAIAVSW